MCTAMVAMVRQYSFNSGNDAVYVDSQQEYFHTSWLDD